MPSVIVLPYDKQADYLRNDLGALCKALQAICVMELIKHVVPIQALVIIRLDDLRHPSCKGVESSRVPATRSMTETVRDRYSWRLFQAPRGDRQ